MKKRNSSSILLYVILVIICALLLFPVQVYRDWAFICENTGSQKGYRQWRFGSESGHWYRKSPLEDFIQSEAPDALVHRWTSYAGTGKNIFGVPILFGHGRPGAILQFRHEIQSKWINKNDTDTVLQLYNLLVSDDDEEIEKRIGDIWEEVMMNYE